MKIYVRVWLLSFLLGLPGLVFGAGQVRTPDIVDAAITTPKLADGAATGVKVGSDVAVYGATTPTFTGNLRVGSGTPATSTTAGSFWVTGPAELGGNFFLDGLTGPSLLWIDSSHQVHLVTLDSTLAFNAGTSTLSVAGAGGSTGTLNKVPKVVGTTPLIYGDSIITDNGKIGINLASPAYMLDIGYGNLDFQYPTAPVAPTATPKLDSTAGQLSNGNYKYKVTFVYSQGQTAPGTASASATVDATHTSINVTGIPLGTQGMVIGRNIYRTVAGGSVYFLDATINDNTSTTLPGPDTVTDATLLTNAAAPALDQSTGWILDGGTRVAQFTNAGSNLFLGTNAGIANTSGVSNVFVGANAGQANTSGTSNTSVGQNSFTLHTTGLYDTNVGYDASHSDTTGTQNTVVGAFANLSGTTSGANTIVGYDALANNTTSNNNTVLGAFGMLNYNDVGASSYNTSFGQSAGVSLVNGLYNLFLGANADYLAPGDTFLGGTAMTGVKSNGGANNELPAGTYKYVVTFTIGGVETGISAPLSVTTDASNQEVTLSNIPTYQGPLIGTVNRKVYRSTLASPLTYRLLTNGLIADNTTTSIVDSTTDATIASNAVPSRVSSSIVMGQNAKAMVGSQMVVGSQQSPITDVYIGNGISPGSTSATGAGQAVTIHASGGSGSNQAGGNLTLASGQGTGTSASGAMIFQTAPVGTSGATWNALVERMRIMSGGATGPAASATESLVRIGSTNIAAGSGSGTFLGVNAPTGYGGYFNEYEVNGVSKEFTDSSGNLTIAGKATAVGTINTGGVKVHRTTVASGSYSVLVTDYYIVLTGTTGGAFTLPLAATAGAGAVFIIKDGGRNAGTSNLTINRSGSDTIDGATSLVFSTNGESAMLISDGVSNYEIN